MNAFELMKKIGFGSSNRLIAQPWDISNAYYDSKNYYMGESIYSNYAIYIKPDGTKLYIASSTYVYQYSLSTAWDISTASYDSKNFNFSTYLNPHNVRILYFSNDGLYCYVGGNNDDRTLQFSLSTAWDISTASNTGKYCGFPMGQFMNSDGTKCYGTKPTYNVTQSTLSTAWDLQTNTSIKSYNPSSQTEYPESLSIKTDGAKMFILDLYGHIYQYSLSTAWDISTASYDSKGFNTNFLNARSLFFKSDGTKFYVSGDGRYIYQYEI